MRKIFILAITIFIMVVLQTIYSDYAKKNTDNISQVIDYVDNENNYDKRRDYYLSFENEKLDTNNFLTFFSCINGYPFYIEQIYPSFSLIYDSYLKEDYGLKFYGNSLKEGLNNFYKKYIQLLEEKNLTEELDRSLTSGIKIQVIKVSTSMDAINKLINNYPNVKSYTSITEITRYNHVFGNFRD